MEKALHKLKCSARIREKEITRGHQALPQLFSLFASSEHLSIVIWKMSKALDVDRCPARDLARHWEKSAAGFK